ncbi:TetR/AcrR family transcriptional regulator [Tsukamurella paurometabola]|uniref:DNA-binding transcriptional repressor FabR n=1 Tax=Tsukamurella paurometabola TaxID=2061 RepID=A0A3P8MDC3_TSUPA|nr:TetR/AcrR family transcriptional regulator [Tsukamurella paurometabola]MBS4103313.1 TetR/AcrR family transcriptional regulator [Tsukamurella paurometabola]UEA81702.1 TetR/AcrR family transcriptional regulator [Tsukamurella paurometabola]VDR38713.1 DNA-binding transcriptional repressor FabR [Tsukamurella paurometabola]
MTPSKLSREWRGVGPDERIAHRRQTLIDAGLTDITDRGAAAVSISGVCATAGLTQRYFYESFRNKDEFLLAVLDTVVLRARTVILEALESAPTDAAPAVVQHLVTAFTEYLDEDRRRPKLMFLQTRSHPALALRGNELAREFIEPISLALKSPLFHRPASVDVPTTEIQVTALAIFGAMSQLYAAWTVGFLDVDSSDLVAHVTSVVVRCLEYPGVATHIEEPS